MDPDKFQQAWKADAAQTRVTIDADSLSKVVRRSHEGFQSTIFSRDLREARGSLLMIPVWFYVGSTMSLPWTWYLMVPALIWVAGFFVVDRKRHPQRPSPPGEPLLYYVKESLTQVEHQIWLLRNVFWWYLLPFSIAIMAFFLQVAWETSSNWWGFVVFSGGLGLFLLVAYWATYLINQRAVRVRLEPRRQDLLKLVASLEDETKGEDSGDIFDLVSALTDPVWNCGLNSSWAENWNILIPSWRESLAVILPTLLGGFCGLQFPIPDMGPVLFQSVVGATIPFEIALVCVWVWSRRKKKKKKKSAAADNESNAQAAGVDLQDSVDPTPQRLPKAPAIAIIVLTSVVGIMAVYVVFHLIGDSKFRGEFLRGPGLGDVSEFSDNDISHMDSWMQTMRGDTYPSLSAVVVRDGEIVYQGAFGFEDTTTERPATTQTQYHVASVTKAFTASLAVILHEQGVVDLDQPVAKYLPDGVSISTTPEVGATITLRQLAVGTSGLPRGVPGQVQSVEGWYQLEPQRLYDHLSNVKLHHHDPMVDVRLKFDPDTSDGFSNLGFGLLGHALERAAGKPFDRLMKEFVCDPLKLERTAIQADDKLRLATGYDWRSHSGATTPSRTGAKIKHSFKERLAASDGLVTTVEDLAKFLAAQMKPGVFTREMLDQLHTETTLSDGTASGTAFGWSVGSIDGVGRVLEKTGHRSNCNAWIGFLPEHGVGVAVMTNCGGPEVDPIGHKLLEQSIPLSQRKLVTEGWYANVAPYSGVRWENDRPIVCVHDKWSPLASIDGIPIDRIMKFANKEYGDIARKRFAEDLVRLLSQMGHEPERKVTLGLKTQDGQIEQLQILMTEENRNLVRDQNKPVE
ncbi:MAG: CubicO group peptidase (beta-lactamase class C family) [Porticoccaceae bacterium]|jgi:CubicO group peptidase (beta-lactamase class C family)